MLSLTQHLQLQISCLAYAESSSVSIDTVRESQRLLDDLGSGMASYRCPASYLASLAWPEAITRFERIAAATSALAPELARWESEGGATEPSS